MNLICGVDRNNFVFFGFWRRSALTHPDVSTNQDMRVCSDLTNKEKEVLDRPVNIRSPVLNHH
jgi:hypothetical protein